VRRRRPKSSCRQPAPPLSAIEWRDVHDGAALTLDIGYALVGLVDERKNAPLMARITGIRRQLSRELGFVVPLVRVRDELSLAPNQYRITLSGMIIGEDEVFPYDLLALDSGDIEGVVEGRAVKDPTFGLDALWIGADQRSDAIVAGYTVVDASTVVATHLNRAIMAAG
jgi:flagellar biosynthesis protein FlhA